MGCDIHGFVEIRRNGKWEKFTEEIFNNPWYKYWEEDIKKGKPLPSYAGGPLQSNPLDFRNYDAFAILADVRNGRGFAGIPTGSGWNPISAPRGIPEDASDEYKEVVTKWDTDGHSHSWITLQELLDYKWDTESCTLYGIFSEYEYIRFLMTGKVGTYSADVYGRDIVKLTPEQWLDLFSGDDFFKPTSDKRTPKSRYYIHNQWKETAREAAPILPEIADTLLTYASNNNLLMKDFRLVFFFDN